MTQVIERPSTGKTRSITDYKIRPASDIRRTIASLIVAVLVASLAWSFVTNPKWGWGIVAKWLFAPSILAGLWTTLKLTFISGLVGFSLGAVLALMRLSSSPFVRGTSWTFSWIFRSTPLLVQLLIWYNIGYLYKTVGLWIPFTDTILLRTPANHVFTPLLAAVLGLGLNLAAYSAEIFRGGILSVDHGQVEAAKALGLPKTDRVWRIILPQAMKSSLPAAFNELISLVKGTAIVYVLAFQELFLTVQIVYARTQEVLPMLLVATVWYVIITSILSVLQFYVERHFSQGVVPVRDRRSRQNRWISNFLTANARGNK